MKTIKQIVVVFIFTFFFSTLNIFSQDSFEKEIEQTNISNSIDENKADIEADRWNVSFEINWGRKSRDCKGFGICGITIVIQFGVEQEDFQGINQDGVLHLSLNQDGLKNINSFFGANEIVLEEDYVLSKEVTKKLGLKKGYRIKKGTYQIYLNPNNKDSSDFLIKM